jgi:hypothetical protein
MRLGRAHLVITNGPQLIGFIDMHLCGNIDVSARVTIRGKQTHWVVGLLCMSLQCQTTGLLSTHPSIYRLHITSTSLLRLKQWRVSPHRSSRPKGRRRTLMPIRASACFSLPTAAFLARGTPQSGAACAGYSHPRAGRHKREEDGRGFSG